MWFLRRMQKISYIEHVTNEEVLRRANVKRALCKKIRQGQARFFGHIMRKESMEQLVTTGKIPGKRSRGRQRIKLTDSLSTWLETTPLNIMSSTREKECYMAIVTNAPGMVT